MRLNNVNFLIKGFVSQNLHNWTSWIERQLYLQIDVFIDRSLGPCPLALISSLTQLLHITNSM